MTVTISAAAGMAPPGRGAIRRADAGLLPFLGSLPFLYLPKILEGDTQPWVLATALLALFTYRPRRFMQRIDVAVALLVGAAIAVYIARAGQSGTTVRLAYILLMFLVLWVLARRGGEDLFAAGVRYTLVLWFVVGAYQYLAVILGLPVDIIGRFVAGRSGVPSLAAEPSYFGSLSVLMVMYLLHRRQRSDAPYVAIAVLCVLMSGSLLSVLLLIFPFLYLRTGVKLLAAGAMTALILLDSLVNEGGLTARLAGFGSAGEGLVGLLIDPSLNLRMGHVWFTLWDQAAPALVFANRIDFEGSYNAFAAGTGFLIPTESPFIVTMAGELVYDCGLIGLGLIALLIASAARGGSNLGERLLRGGLIVVCLLNPVSVANPFLVFYCLQRPRLKAVEAH